MGEVMINVKIEDIWENEEVIPRNRGEYHSLFSLHTCTIINGLHDSELRECKAYPLEYTSNVNEALS